MVLVCACVAALIGRPIWAAAAGAGLTIVYWGLEVLTWHRARERHDLALGLAIGGMVVRLLVVLAGLAAVALLAHAAAGTATLSFLAGFTVYLGLRPLTYSDPARPAPRAGVR